MLAASPNGRIVGKLVAIVVLAALTTSACATAGASTRSAAKTSGRPSGVYTAQVSTKALSGALNGRWFLWLHGGSYTFNYTGKTSDNVIVSGVYTITGHHVTFKDRSGACTAKPGSGGCRYLGCRKAATYAFKLSGSKLEFTEVHDPNAQCELPIVLPRAFRRTDRRRLRT